MTAPAYTPLTTEADMTGTPYDQLWRGTSPEKRLDVLIRASRALESRTGRRLTPFVGLVQSERAEGVDVAGAGNYTGPLPLLEALGRSQAQAYGGGVSVRDVWLDEHAPLAPELWTYSDVTVTLAQGYGGTQVLPGSVLEGPEPDSGHLRLPLGTWCPPGTTIRSRYSGGYTLGVPDDLREACLLQATKFLILRAEPQARSGMDTADLEEEVAKLLAPYART